MASRPTPDPSDDPTEDPAGVAARHDPTPPPLVVAASLVALQGLALVALGVLQLASLTRESFTLGVGVGVFFLAFAVLLLAAARALLRAETWGRGPVLLAQLIQLGLAWTNRQELPLLLTAALVVTAVVAVLGVVHPSSVARLAREP